MSWGTYFTNTYEFHRETYTTLGEAQNALEDTTKRIQELRADLLSYAMMTEPNKFIDAEDPLYEIKRKVNELCDELENESVKQYMLSELVEYWDECHITIDGEVYGMTPREEEGRNSWNGPRYYCDGDYIKSVYPDGTKTAETLDLEAERAAWAETIANMRNKALKEDDSTARRVSFEDPRDI